MPDQNARDGVATKRSPGAESGVRKFTLSCSRCRASKLKCDRKEPCMECVKRNIGHLCTKDERQPRAKRAKADSHANNNTKVNAVQNQEAEAEDVAQVLERFIDGTSGNQSAAFEPISSFVAPDYPNTSWLDPRRQDEKLTLVRETIYALPEVDVIHHLHEVFITRCQGPLGNSVHTPTFMKEAEDFCGCLGLSSPAAQVIALSSTISMDTLACHLLALVLALAFHPTPHILGWSATPLTLRVEELRASDVPSKTWSSLALHCLRGGVSLFCGSIASLQAAVMLLLNGQEGPLELDVILVTAISGAQKLGLHRLGDAKLEASPSPISSFENCPPALTHLPNIRTEIGIRIWWALVMRDWSRGQVLGHYSIHPSQFNTRMPLHINDDDLCPPTLNVNVHSHITEKPRSEFTMLSYTVHALEIALLLHDSIEMRGALQQTQQEERNERAKTRNHLNKKYEKLVASLPSYFRIGSTVGLTSQGPIPAIPVQRWMLHQQLWSLFLRLNQGSLSSQDGRASYQLLAQHIISTQAQIQARCTVCGSLSASETQLFNAAIVLIIDLLFLSKPKDAGHSIIQLSRLMARDKIREAIELLRTRSNVQYLPSPREPHAERAKTSAQRSAFALEALMNLAEEEFGNNEDDSGENCQGGRGIENGTNASASLKSRVMGILEPLQGNASDATAPMEQQANPDLDVLPILSNERNSFWQFLDFPLSLLPLSTTDKNDSFPATADFQPFNGSIPFTPSSAEVSIQESGDVYSDVDGSHISHPSHSGGASEAATTPSSFDAYVAAKLYYGLGDGALSI